VLPSSRSISQAKKQKQNSDHLVMGLINVFLQIRMPKAEQSKTESQKQSKREEKEGAEALRFH